MPDERVSGFFVGRAALKSKASIGRKKLHGVVGTSRIEAIAEVASLTAERIARNDHKGYDDN
jgi:hypothetical protein